MSLARTPGSMPGPFGPALRQRAMLGLTKGAEKRMRNSPPTRHPLGSGIYKSIFGGLLKAALYLSLNFWLKYSVRCACLENNLPKCLCRDVTREDTPAWVSESYQLLSLFLGAMALFIFLPRGLGAWAWYLIIVLVLYRTLEILFFAAHWVFVETKPLHSYARSLMGFLLNLVEIAIFFSIVTLLLRCGSSGVGELQNFMNHAFGILTLGFEARVSLETKCNFVTLFELGTADFLILIVLASLAGQLAKGLKAERSIRRQK